MSLRLTLGNFGPFLDSGEISLEPGLNVVTGLNNTGKTALLWAAFAQRGGPAPPDNSWGDGGRLRTHVGGYVRHGQQGWMRLGWDPGEAERQRAWKLVTSSSGLRGLPLPDEFEAAVTWEPDGPDLGLWLRGLLFRQEHGVPKLLFGSDPARPDLRPIGAAAPSDMLEAFGLSASRAGAPGPFRAAQAGAPKLPWPRLALGCHILAAGRRIPDYDGNVAVAHDLAPDASNLAAVLHTLLSTSRFRPEGRSVFDQISGELRRFFPEVTAMRTEMGQIQQGQTPSVGLNADRGELTVPFGHCGTGVWNALAILTAALLPTAAKLILIDEPSAFLHPAAERELARFLERVGKEKGHMFLVSTHSAILASHARGSLWGTVRQPDGSCRIERLGGFAQALGTLGVTAADILPHDGVLLVEGPSDQFVFRALANETPEGRRVAVVPLGGEGRARVKGGRNICEVVKRVMDAALQIKMPVVALLDSVNWSDSDRHELEKAGHTVFLKKPEIEDYFLGPDALAAVLAEDAEGTPAELRPKIAVALARPEPYPKGSAAISSAFHSAAAVRYDKASDLPRIFAATPPDDPKLGELRGELSAALGTLREAGRASAAEIRGA